MSNLVTTTLNGGSQEGLNPFRTPIQGSYIKTLSASAMMEGQVSFPHIFMLLCQFRIDSSCCHGPEVVHLVQHLAKALLIGEKQHVVNGLCSHQMFLAAVGQ